MIIKELIIYGFGKWVDAHFFLDDSLQLFIGDNEAGKSTLASFIQQILFGFPRSNAREKRYEPKFSTEYGGKIIVEDSKYGRLAIERIAKQKVSGDVTVTFENGENAGEEFLEVLLSPVNKSFYQDIYAFNLDGLQNVAQLSKDEVNRYFIDAGLLGGNRFIKMKDSIDQKMQSLYSPKATKRPLNQAIEKLEALNEKVQRAKEENNKYLALLNQKQNLASNEQGQYQQREKYKERLKRLQKLKEDFPKYKQYKTLQTHFQKQPLVKLPEDGMDKLRRYHDQLETLEKKLSEQEKALEQLKVYYTPPALLEAYQSDVEEFTYVQKQLPYIEEALEQNNRLINQQNELLSKDKHLRAEMDLDNEKIPFIDESDRKKWSAMEKQYGEMQAKEEQLLNDLTKQKEGITSEERRLADSHADPHKNTFTFVAILLMLVGASLWLVTSPVAHVMGSLLIIVGLIAFVLFKQKISAGNEQEISEQKLVDLKQEKSQTEEALELLRQDVNELSINWQEFKASHGLSNQFDKWTSTQAQLTLERAYELNEQLEDVNQQLDYFYRRVDKFENHLSSIKPLMSSKRQQLKAYIAEIRQLIDTLDTQKAQQATYLEKRQYVENVINGLHEEKAELKRAINVLLSSIKASSEADFIMQYETYAQEKEWYTNFNDLSTNLADNLADFENYNSEAGIATDIQKTKEKIEMLSQSIRDSRDKAVENLADINLLEDGGKYSSLLQQQENQKSVLSQLVDEWVSLAIQSELIRLTLAQAQEGLLPETLTTASQLFNKLTDKRYTDVLFIEDSLCVKRSDRDIFPASELSTATAEQLYVALRFAFVLSINQKMALPVIIDDGFVNFDYMRSERVWEVISDVSQHTQVIAFTHERKLCKLFPEDHIITL